MTQGAGWQQPAPFSWPRFFCGGRESAEHGIGIARGSNPAPRDGRRRNHDRAGSRRSAAQSLRPACRRCGGFLLAIEDERRLPEVLHALAARRAPAATTDPRRDSGRCSVAECCACSRRRAGQLHQWQCRRRAAGPHRLHCAKCEQLLQRDFLFDPVCGIGSSDSPEQRRPIQHQRGDALRRCERCARPRRARPATCQAAAARCMPACVHQAERSAPVVVERSACRPNRAEATPVDSAGRGTAAAAAAPPHPSSPVASAQPCTSTRSRPTPSTRQRRPAVDVTPARSATGWACCASSAEICLADPLQRAAGDRATSVAPWCCANGSSVERRDDAAAASNTGTASATTPMRELFIDRRRSHCAASRRAGARVRARSSTVFSVSALELGLGEVVARRSVRRPAEQHASHRGGVRRKVAADMGFHARSACAPTRAPHRRCACRRARTAPPSRRSRAPSLPDGCA